MGNRWFQFTERKAIKPEDGFMNLKSKKILDIVLLSYFSIAIGFAAHATWQFERHEEQLNSVFNAMATNAQIGARNGDADYVRALAPGAEPQNSRYERLTKGHNLGLFFSTVILSTQGLSNGETVTADILHRQLALMISGYNAAADPMAKSAYAEQVAEIYKDLGNSKEQSHWSDIFEKEQSVVEKLHAVLESAEAQQRWNVIALLMAKIHWESRLLPNRSTYTQGEL